MDETKIQHKSLPVFDLVKGTASVIDLSGSSHRVYIDWLQARSYLDALNQDCSKLSQDWNNAKNKTLREYPIAFRNRIDNEEERLEILYRLSKALADKIESYTFESCEARRINCFENIAGKLVEKPNMRDESGFQTTKSDER